MYDLDFEFRQVLMQSFSVLKWLREKRMVIIYYGEAAKGSLAEGVSIGKSIGRGLYRQVYRGVYYYLLIRGKSIGGFTITY